MVLAQILPFFGTFLDSTFPGTSPEPFSVLAQILLFFGTFLDSTFPGTRPDHFWYSPEFYPSLVLARILLFSNTRLDSTFFSTRPDHFLVLALILPFTDTGPDYNILLYSPRF